jgi:hypothetical protein
MHVGGGWVVVVQRLGGGGSAAGGAVRPDRCITTSDFLFMTFNYSFTAI